MTQDSQAQNQPTSVEVPQSAPIDVSAPQTTPTSTPPISPQPPAEVKSIKPVIKKATLGQELLHSRELPFILFLGVVMLLAWIYLSVRKVTQQATVPPEVQQQTKQMNPNIDVDSIQKVRDRRFFSDEELTSFPLVKVDPSPEPGEEGIRQTRPSPTPVIQQETQTETLPQPTATPEPTPEPTAAP